MLPLCFALHLGEQFASITVCGLHFPFPADLTFAAMKNRENPTRLCKDFLLHLLPHGQLPAPTVSHTLYSSLPPNASRSSCLDHTVAMAWDHRRQGTACCPILSCRVKVKPPPPGAALEHWGLLATAPHCSLHSPIKGSVYARASTLVHKFIH